MHMAALSQHVSKRTLAPHARFITLEVSAVDDSGEAVEVPYIRYRLSGPELALADAAAAAGAAPAGPSRGAGAGTQQ